MHRTLWLAAGVTLCSCFTVAPNGFADSLSWTGDAGAGNEQWSNGANFSTGVPPTATDDVTFDDATSTSGAGIVSNIVDSPFTISNLTYTTSVDAGNAYHTTQINSGAVLTVTGNFTQGLGNPPLDEANEGAGDGTNVTITGPGSLVFDNSSGSFLMGNFSGRWDRGQRLDTLDLSGLPSFTMNANHWEVGRVGMTNPLVATMTLADVNDITATLLNMAEWNDTALLELGQANIFNIDTIDLGYNVVNSANGSIRFRTGLSNPSITIRDRSGTGPADLLMAKPSQSNASGNLDLTGGTVDAQFDRIEMGFGRPDQHSGNANGTITFDQGSMSASTVLLAQIRDAGNAGGSINLNGTAVFSAAEITMGDIVDSRSNGLTGLATARISLGGGTLKAETIQPGRNQADIVRPHVREIAFASGRIQDLGGGLTIDPAISMVLDTAATHSLYAEAGQTITVGAVVSETGAGTAGLSIDGPGTVLLNADNTYTGNTTVATGATLGGEGSISGLVHLFGSIAPGASVGTFSTNSQTWFANAAFTFEIDNATGQAGRDGTLGGGWDLLDVAGQLSFTNPAPGAFAVDLTSLQPGGGTNAGPAANFSADSNYAWEFVRTEDPIASFDPSWFEIDTSGFANSLTGRYGVGEFGVSRVSDYALAITFTAAVPEPSALVLAVLGLMAAATVRRRSVETRCR